METNVCPPTQIEEPTPEPFFDDYGPDDYCPPLPAPLTIDVFFPLAWTFQDAAAWCAERKTAFGSLHKTFFFDEDGNVQQQLSAWAYECKTRWDETSRMEVAI